MNRDTNPAVIATALTGVDLIAQPLLNKGTAFSEEERDAFRLHGILPPSIGNLEGQVRRRLAVLRKFRDQVLYLKHNLNAAAIGSLRGQADNIQGDIQRLMEQMNRSIAEADRFIQTL